VTAVANAFLEALASGRVLLADGGVGTGLQSLGLAPGQPPEELVFDRLDVVLDLHRQFAEAGADIILTNTFGGTRIRLAHSAYPDRVRELNARAVELACEAAAASGALVAGAIGPTGALLTSLPFGTLDPGEAREAFAEQAAALADGGCDLLVVETQFALDEAAAAVQGARDATDLPVVASFSFDRDSRLGPRTMMGVAAKQLVETIVPLGVAAVGANCGGTIETTEAVIAELAALLPGLPLWAKPNAGLPTPGTFPACYPLRPAQAAKAAVRFADAGARIIGGCCGTTPGHIRAIAEALGSRAVA
jgi:5-methyltetrahydrofolate--homocysteine methyltransferase